MNIQPYSSGTYELVGFKLSAPGTCNNCGYLYDLCLRLQKIGSVHLCSMPSVGQHFSTPAQVVSSPSLQGLIDPLPPIIGHFPGFILPIGNGVKEYCTIKASMFSVLLLQIFSTHVSQS